MATSGLGACEAFVVDLRRSNLLERSQLEQVLGDFLKKQPMAEPADLAEFLVRDGVLSPFQADRILKGKPLDMVLGPYTLVADVGSGSMGTVYKARNKSDENWYAVKVLPRRSMWNVLVARRQVRAYEQCQHPTVVPFLDVGTSGGTHYLVWPFVEGEPLEGVIQQNGKLPLATAAQYIQQIAAGLGMCHRQGLVHGTLKPSNLMVASDGQVRILDFGIGSLLAAAEGESLIDTQSMANAQASGLDCVSPESIVEPTNLTPAGDQYSLGCVFYFCLSGRYPFPEETAVAKMVAHQTKQPTPIRELVPEMPTEMATIVERLMQKTPTDRYAHVEEIVDELGRLAAATPAPTPAAAPSRPLPTRQSLLGRGAPTPPPPEPEPAAPPPRRERTAPREPVAPQAAEPPARGERLAPRPPATPPVEPPAHSERAAPHQHAPAEPPARKERVAPPPEPRRQPPSPPREPVETSEPPVGPRGRLDRLAGRDPAATPSRAAAPPSRPAAPPPTPRLDEKTLMLLLKTGLARDPLLGAGFAQLVQTALRLLKRGGDTVGCTALAPPAVSQGDAFPLCVLLHRPHQAELARRLAREFVPAAGTSNARSLEIAVPKGAELTFHLSIYGLGVEEPTQRVGWHGAPASAQFVVQVPPDHKPGMVTGRVTVNREQTSLGHIEFTLVVRAAGEKTAEELLPIGDAAHRYS